MVALAEPKKMEEPSNNVKVVVEELSEDEGEKEKILNLLTDVGICKLCSINFTSSDHPGIAAIYGDYDFNVDELQTTRETHCYLCLGILEEFNIWAVAKKIAGKMEELKYDSADFSLGVFVPQCVFLRRSAMVSYMTEKLNLDGKNINLSNMALLKNIARYFLSQLVMKFSNKSFVSNSKLFVEVKYTFSNDQKETENVDSLVTLARKRKLEESDNKMKKVSYSSIISNLQQSDIKKYAIYPPKSSAEVCTYKVGISHSNIFFGGRYNKYCRTLSHTWEDGAAHEFIGEKLKEMTHASALKFISTGSEDVDVKILGEGKPFVVELIDPKICALAQEQLSKLQVDINSLETMAVHHLQKVNKAGLDLMRKGECGKVKTYKAKLRCSQSIPNKSIEKVNGMRNIEIKQSTPVRLLHVQSPEDKQVTIHELELKRADEHYELMLKASGESYVKEFIYGDLGRTEPSLSTLLNVPLEINELDFIEMDLDWPPQLEGQTDSNEVV